MLMLVFVPTWQDGESSFLDEGHKEALSLAASLLGEPTLGA
jgi:hypothetical protein